MSDHDPPERPEDRVDLTGLGRLSERPPPPRRERAAPIVRGLSILLLAIAAAGLPWYFFTKTDEKPRPAGSPGPTGSATESPTPSATPTLSTYEIFGVESCVNLRSVPDTSGERLDCLVPGIRLDSDGQTMEGDGLLWRHVFYARRSLEGWIADKYLKPIP